MKKDPEGFVFDFTTVELLTSAGIQVLITTMRMLAAQQQASPDYEVVDPCISS